MIFIKHNKGFIEFIHHMPFDVKHGLGKTEDELRLEGILVDSIPEPVEQEGKAAVLKVNTDTQELFYEYEDLQPTAEDEVMQLKRENATLQSAVSEITMYVAEQDAKIEQQNQAISELSILIAGGNA